MTNEMDNLLREKISNLDSTPPGVSWDKDSSWEKIEQRQHAAKIKVRFIKGIIGMVVVASIAGSAYVLNDKKSETVAKEEKATIPAYEIQKVNLISASCESASKLKESKKISLKSFSSIKSSPIKEAETSEVWSDTFIASPSVKEENIQEGGDTSKILESKRARVAEPTYDLEEDHRLGKVWSGNLIFGSNAEQPETSALKVKKKRNKRRNKGKS
jgi:hypothetical protein